MTFLELFQLKLQVHNLEWCRSCCAKQSHARGFVLHDDRRTVHLDSNVVTRAALHRALHEIAHCVLPEFGLRRWECELQANRWAEDVMRSYGISVPRNVAAAGRSYERRMKRWGDNIRKGARR